MMIDGTVWAEFIEQGGGCIGEVERAILLQIRSNCEVEMWLKSIDPAAEWAKDWPIPEMVINVDLVLT